MGLYSICILTSRVCFL